MTETINIDELTCPCLKCALGKASKKVYLTYENGSLSRIRTDCVITEKKIKWNAKFTDSEARAVRKEYENGSDMSELAEKYGVRKMVIYRIVKGITYNRGA